jgi:hypothetical protein
MKSIFRIASATVIALTLSVAVYAADEGAVKVESAGSSPVVTEKKGRIFKAGSSEKPNFKQCSKCYGSRKGNNAADKTGGTQDSTGNAAVPAGK